MSATVAPEDVDPDDDMRVELENTFLSNEISAKRFLSLVQKSKRAGVKGLSALNKHNLKSKSLKRDMMRKVLKSRPPWCQIYWSPISLYDPASGQNVQVLHPFILPHEMLTAVSNNSPDKSLAAARPGNLDHHAHMQDHIKQVAHQLGEDWQDYIAIGLHGDGVPFGKSNDSLEVISLNLPCWQENGVQSKLRVPFSCVQRKHMDGQTMQDIFDILSWSLKWCAIGMYPKVDQHGNQFVGKRGEMAGSQLTFKGLLVEIRADWCFLKQAFGFPQHNENAGVCWLCCADPSNWHCVDEHAPWREARLTPSQFHQRQLEKNLVPSSIFSIPGASCALVKPDWLHICDIGVTADIAGNVFVAVIKHIPGRSIKDKVGQLWEDLKGWYKLHPDITEKLDQLKYECFVQNKKPPKLKGKASAIRQLVGFLPYICRKRFGGTPLENAVQNLTDRLAQLYFHLHHFDASRVATLGREVAVLYKSIREHSLQMSPTTLAWKLKPKVHLFQELTEYVCPMAGNPKYAWTYKDEDFGGYLVRMSSKRGGKNSSKSSALAVIQRFFARNRLPSLYRPSD